MPDPKKPLCPLETLVVATYEGTSDDCKVDAYFSDRLPEAVEMTPEEIGEKTREIVRTHLALREETAKLAEKKSTKVGYSKAYADNYDAVFGKGDASELLN